ncbi:glycosyltransferase family 1 protein [Raineyella sp. LH-20]|uniref:glycosyltransferase family 4 protein n=1 Tax=Raineyella sp. LH-20 TaxID=3081204 RepID=UPI002954749F|nr:glycosyltransferase family 1 protein [Raineyella sp. LH-20]WOP20093.1 glycosyltransferase family 1 protein [Raineyella sp. LH-20]
MIVPSAHPTRILVDLLFYTGTRGGMESVVRHLYGALTPAMLQNVQLVALASRELAAAGAPWFPGPVIDSGIASSGRVGWALGEQTVGLRAARLRADVVHCPANFGPAFSPVPVVLTIHDLISFRFPEYVPGRLAGIQRTLLRAGARSARRVLTVSTATATDLAEHLALPSEKVTVVPPAGSGRRPAGVTRRTDLLFSLGNRMPHKNFVGLLEALALIVPARRPHLVITGGGPDDPLTAEVARLGLADWVDLAGWLPSEEVDQLYAEATLLVFPTLFEGFGLPVLEAMSAGCPVLCTDLPVLHEVAGDAAAYVDSRDPQALADAIAALLDDPAERARLAVAGSARAAEFSWERTAEQTLSALVAAARA